MRQHLTTAPSKGPVVAVLGGGGTVYNNQPVHLYYHVSGRGWVYSQRSGVTNASGCIPFNDVPTGRSYALQAYKPYTWNGYYWEGWSPSASPLAQQGNYVYNLGTGRLSAYYF